YYKRDLLRASDRDFITNDVLVGSLYPKDENTSIMFSGRHAITRTVDAFADILYTHRRSYNEAGQVQFEEKYRTKNPQLNATAGVNWQMGRDWMLEAAVTHATNKLDQMATGLRLPNGATLFN